MEEKEMLNSDTLDQSNALNADENAAGTTHLN